MKAKKKALTNGTPSRNLLQSPAPEGETPRTDEKVFVIELAGGKHQVVFASDVRQLERELSQAKFVATSWKDKFMEVSRENAELRRKLATATLNNSEKHSLIERLHIEADLCRNDGAQDIANLLDEAVAFIELSQAKRELGGRDVPEFIVKRVQREIDDALHPRGMSTHDGKVKLHISDVQRLLSLASPTQSGDGGEWVRVRKGDLHALISEARHNASLRNEFQDWECFETLAETMLSAAKGE